MTEPNKKPTDDELDAMIREAVGQSFDDEVAYYEKMAREQGLAPSEQFYENIRSMTREHIAAQRRAHRRKLAQRIAAVVLIAVVIQFTLYTNVEAYRLVFQQLSLTPVKGGSTMIEAVPPEDDRYVAPAPPANSALELTTPDDNCPFELWLPEGYELTIADGNEISMFYRWENTRGEYLDVSISLHEYNEKGVNTGGVSAFDSEDATQQDTDVNNLPAHLFSQRKLGFASYRIVWSDVNYIYNLSVDYLEADDPGYDELLTIAESIREKIKE